MEGGRSRYIKCVICREPLLDEKGEQLNQHDDGQIDVCVPCQLACKWREVAIRSLHHKRRAISSHDGCHEEWLDDQREITQEAVRLYHEHSGILPDKLPEPPASKTGSFLGRHNRR